MSEAFLTEIRIVSFGFAPSGWALCNGQLLPINQNQAMFALIGTTYGGNGQTSFALPNFRGRVPIHVGNGHVLGEAGGVAAHTLTVAETAHGHPIEVLDTPGLTGTPGADRAPAIATREVYGRGNPSSLLAMDVTEVAPGGGQAHPNLQPVLALNFIIALQGIFPTRN